MEEPSSVTHEPTGDLREPSRGLARPPADSQVETLWPPRPRRSQSCQLRSRLTDSAALPEHLGADGVGCRGGGGSRQRGRLADEQVAVARLDSARRLGIGEVLEVGAQ